MNEWDGSGRPLDGVPSIYMYTVPELARILRVSGTTVRREIVSGNLVGIRVGKCFRVPERALYDYLERGQQRTIFPT